MEEGIKKILEKIKFVKEREKKKIEELRKELEEEERKEEEYRKRKASVFNESFKTAEQIFDWAKKLLSHKEIDEVFSFFNGTLDAGLTLMNMIPIFHGSGYHDTKPVEDRHACASLYLKKDGTFFYRERWKWAEGIHLEIKTPEEMARKLDPKFIKETLNTIKTDKIWENISRFVERS